MDKEQTAEEILENMGKSIEHLKLFIEGLMLRYGVEIPNASE
jgi:hypothetical protein